MPFRREKDAVHPLTERAMVVRHRPRRYLCLDPRDATGLAVVLIHLIDEHRQRRVAFEPGVGTPSIVGVDPARQPGEALSVERYSRAYAHSRWSVPMNRSALPLVWVAAAGFGRGGSRDGEQAAEAGRVGVGPGVVGHHPLDPDAVTGEEGDGVRDEAHGARRLLVGPDSNVGHPGRIVDRDVEVVVAERR